MLLKFAMDPAAVDVDEASTLGDDLDPSDLLVEEPGVEHLLGAGGIGWLARFTRLWIVAPLYVHVGVCRRGLPHRIYWSMPHGLHQGTLEPCCDVADGIPPIWVIESTPSLPIFEHFGTKKALRVTMHSVGNAAGGINPRFGWHLIMRHEARTPSSLGNISSAVSIGGTWP
jgi:hypothetical protein